MKSTLVRPSSNLKGIIFMLLTCLIVTTGATLIKTLGQELNTFQVVMLRCFFTLMITLTFNFHLGKILFKTNRPKMMAYRSTLTFIVVVANFYAVSHLPLIEVTALQFSKPLFLIVLAAVFIGERIRIFRTSATIVGFIGILIILHPWDNAVSGGLRFAHVAALVAALTMSVLAILSRIMTKDHNPTTLVFYANAGTVLLCIVPAIYFWTTPTGDQMLLIAGLGITTFCGQYCMISAYKYAEVTVVTPFEYFRIIFAAIVGYFIFSEIPDNWTIWGGALICTSTLFIAYREAYKAKNDI